MQLISEHRRNITGWYCFLFYALALFKWLSGLLLYQLKPFIFNNRFDLFSWIFLKTGTHQWLLNNPVGWVMFDATFYAMPLMLWLAYLKSSWLSTITAAVMLVVNWVYIQCYTLYPANSIESYIAWLLFPILFMALNVKTFYFLLHGLRYFFLFFFSSAGIWKIVQQGIFNMEQMSGVLLYQHKEYLTSSSNWYSTSVLWLINHSSISYLLYFAAFLVELSFIIGFFTKKFDLFLAAAFLLFLLMDILLMRINYAEVSPFLLTLIYSRYRPHPVIKS